MLLISLAFKSSGLPDIPIRLFKNGPETLARPLTLLTNRTINGGTLSVVWKYAVVTPVHNMELLISKIVARCK